MHTFRSLLVFLLLGAPAFPQPDAGKLLDKHQPQPGENYKAVLYAAGLDWCGTRDSAGPKDAGCYEGGCDNPVIRNPAIPSGATPIKTYKLFFHILCEDSGATPAATQADIDAQMVQLNADFAGSRMQFFHDWRFVNDSRFRGLRGFEETDMKDLYALSPDDQINVYVVQGQAGYGGKGTFPWTDAVLGARGGIIMDEDAFGAGHKTLTHEVGHNLGLWHTHHGVSEVEPCSACYERANGTDADGSGDFCADTAPTPVNFECAGPGGSDQCSATSWGATDPQNYMGYAPDSCLTEFSAQQMGRMHCWSQDVLGGWYTELGDARIDLDRDVYNCADTVSVTLRDDDLAGAGTAVAVLTGASGDLETLVLGETSAGVFAGSIVTSSSGGSDNDATLNLLVNDSITATYADASNAVNLPEVVTDGAALDCVAPVISNVRVDIVTNTFAKITFETDQMAVGGLLYGASCGSVAPSTAGALTTEHAVTIGGLTQGATYRFQATATDAAANTATEDNGGACFQFTTANSFDYLTERFTSRPDLQFIQLTYTPSNTGVGYKLCVEEANSFPTSTTGASNTPLSDDGSYPVTLTGGHKVPFRGVEYTDFWINANGNVTFDSADISWEGTTELHFTRPRVSAMFVDLNLGDGGNLYRQELADRYVVTWVDIAEYDQSDSSNFQMELYYDGRIVITYLDMEADFGVAGISPGLGSIALPAYSDLSEYGLCDISPYITGESFVEEGADVTLQAVADGLTPPVSYAWTRNGEAAGTDSDTLELTGVTPAQQGVYRVSITDGSKALYVSSPFVLRVVPVGDLPVLGGMGLVLLTGIISAIIAWRNRR